MLHEPAPAHEADADARKEQYRQALQSGDRHRLLRMVRDIHAQHQARKAQGKHRTPLDGIMLRRHCRGPDRASLGPQGATVSNGS